MQTINQTKASTMTANIARNNIKNIEPIKKAW